LPDQPSLFEGLSAPPCLRRAEELALRVPTRPNGGDAQASIGELERVALQLGLRQLIGVDEAGRGPWAGPVVAAAVLFPPQEALPPSLRSLNDSKKLSDAQRRALLRPIYEHALAIGVGHACARQIEAENILQATFSAMRQALERLHRRLTLSGASLSAEALLVIDGKQRVRFPEGGAHPARALTQHPLISGDARSWSVAAASVIAKVTRDERMCAYGRRYPGYGFERHKGYGTKQHQEALQALGPCPVHRLTYKPLQTLLSAGQVSEGRVKKDT